MVALDSANNLSDVDSVPISRSNLGITKNLKYDYGAAFDGTTNDTSTWNAAIADMNAGLVRCIELPEGASKISTSLNAITASEGAARAQRRLLCLLRQAQLDASSRSVLHQRRPQKTSSFMEWHLSVLT